MSHQKRVIIKVGITYVERNARVLNDSRMEIGPLDIGEIDENMP
jgi:hypothetical protein